MINEQKIPCPVCTTAIPFDVRQLLMGVQFTCPNCLAAIGLAVESKDSVNDALEKFKDVKQRLSDNT